MATIRVRVKVDGDTLVLPRLPSLIGKTVDIEVIERPDEAAPTDRWNAAAEAARGLAEYDFDAWSDQQSGHPLMPVVFP